MKAKLTRSDGSVLEAEGTAEELRQLLEPLQGIPTTIQVPVYVPGVCLRPHLDAQPWPQGTIYCYTVSPPDDSNIRNSTFPTA